MQARRRARRWRWAALAALLACPFAQAALQFELQPDGLDGPQILAAERALQDMKHVVPAAWQDRFDRPVRVGWSATLPDH
ncbi:MAG: hypothetical protein RR834_14470, partial [Thermomonas sp.]